MARLGPMAATGYGFTGQTSNTRSPGNSPGVWSSERLEKTRDQRLDDIKRASKMRSVTRIQKGWEVRLQADELQVNGRVTCRGQCRWDIMNLMEE